MKLDVHVMGRKVASLFREHDEYVLQYNVDATPADFVSLTMPVREAPWRWPRDLHPFFRQNLPEGYVLNLIREKYNSTTEKMLKAAKAYLLSRENRCAQCRSGA